MPDSRLTTDERSPSGLAARAAVRRERLIEIGFELLGEKGAAGTTVREVCVRARLNPRYFYESFADLDALLVAVYDGLVAETLALALAAVAAAPDDQVAKTRGALATGIRHMTADPRRIRILFVESFASAALVQRRARATALAAETMVAQAASFHGIAAEDPRLQASGHFLAGGLAELLVAWQNGSLPCGVDELIEHATALVAGTGSAARGP
jgi:AcrR family transcriptional regulator